MRPKCGMSCLASSPFVRGLHRVGAPLGRDVARSKRGPTRWETRASSSDSDDTGDTRRLRSIPGSFAVGETVDSGAGTTLVIRELLGRGSFGTTYACDRPEIGEEVALKVLTLREMRDWKALQLFEREAKTLKGLSHPAIPEYVDHFEVDSDEDVKFCLVQRIAPGKSLQTLVDGGWRPTEGEIFSIATQLLQVLEYLASLRPPVIHRDVKPGNLLFNKATGKLSLVDFGATAEAAMTAAVSEEKGFAMGSTMIGTFGYAAPEQLMGGVTCVSDLYSAGAVLLFLLSGRAPSTMPSSRLKINFRGVVRIEDKRLERIVTRLLEPSPEDRYQNATQALEVLTGDGKVVGLDMDTSNPDTSNTSTSTSLPIVPGVLAEFGGFEINKPARPTTRTRKPSGTRVVVERVGSTKLLLVIPPAGITAGSAATGGFAVAWNSFVAFWTVSALAAGGGLLMAAFSIPFWFAGKQVASAAFAEIFEATRLEIDAASASYSLTVTATGLVSNERVGELLDVNGAVIEVNSVTNRNPDYFLKLEIGATPVTFGRGLQEVELEYVAGEINDFLGSVR